MDKSQLRKDFKEKRKNLSDQKKYKLDQGVSSRLKSLILKNSFKKVHIFLPIEKFREFNSFILLNDKDLSHVEFVIPVVSGEKMLTVRYIPEDISISNWGIPEPVKYKEVKDDDIDLVLVPLLVCDQKGNRVGYGKGFYDRFMSKLSDKIMKLGVSYFDPIHEEISNDSWDVKLDALMLADKMLEF